MAAQWQEKHLLKDWSQPPPWPLFILGKWLLTLLRWLMTHLPPPPLAVFDLNMGMWRTQILYTVTNLGVADVLADGPQTAEQIADRLGAQPGPLYRVLRAAVQLGLFAVKGRDAQGRPRFCNNALSAVLREDHPNCLKHMVLHQTDHNKPAWDELAWGVRTGGQPFERTHGGLSQFAWLKANPKEEDKFSKAMSEIDGMGTQAICTDYGWNGHLRIIDVGGAYGSFLANLLRVNRKPAGVLFDQAQVIKRAKELWEEDERKRGGLLDRVEFHGGDFFNHATIPAGRDGDVYLMRLILHDWNDADSVAILSNIRRAMGGARAKLVIAETAIGDEFSDPVFQRGVLDVHMLAALNGAERTVQQWTELFASSGFRYAQLIRTRGIFSIVEAVPV